MTQHVKGYGVKTSYDAPYLKGHDFDPADVFAHAGDPELQAERQKAKKAAKLADKFTADPEQTSPTTVTIPTPPKAPEDK